MKKLIIHYSLLLLLGTGIGQLRAQTLSRSVIASGGSSFSSSSLQADWTIGETITGGFSGGNLQVGQGFQQGPDAASTHISRLHKDRQVELFPNPADDILHLRLLHTTVEVTDLQLWSADGRKIAVERKLVNPAQWSITVNSLAPGTYFLSAHHGNEALVLPFIKR